MIGRRDYEAIWVSFVDEREKHIVARGSNSSVARADAVIDFPVCRAGR
jgi:hypothetical protein